MGRFVFRWRLVVLMLAMTILACGAAVAREPLPEGVLEDLARALDAAEREGFLARLDQAAVAYPGHALEIAAAGALLAPWLGPAVAEGVLGALDEPDALAPTVMAAVLVALEGRRAAAVAGAVRSAAPNADATVVDGLERLFSDAVASSVPGGFLAAEAVDLPSGVAEALAAGTAAAEQVAGWVRAWEALAPLPQDEGRAAAAVAPTDDEGGTMERQDPALESRFRVPSGS